jgi:hypothetical protein
MKTENPKNNLPSNQQQQVKQPQAQQAKPRIVQSVVRHDSKDWKPTTQE